MGFKSDIEIAQEAKPVHIREIAKKINLTEDDLEYYGKYKAKVDYNLLETHPGSGKKAKLILTTAINPTPAGEGKTTVTVGVGDALSKIGKNVVIALREPSLGPVFGVKGGAAGGGYAQVVPMEDINLHFTGDFHAITSAHNMISALLDNYIYQHRDEGFALKEVLWKRVLDVNDRNLRSIITGLGAKTDGVMMESGFDITPASEIMAILCLATDLSDLKERINGYQLLIYVCEGNDSEKLEWFKTINIASVPLTEQELRNATYCGTWVTSAKKYFGKRNCSAVKLGEGYVNTTNTLDQKLLETVIKWHAMATSEDMRHPMSIEQYMATHQHDKNCYELRTYFESVMSWVQTIFSHLRKEMKGLPWGEYYNLYKDSASTLDPKEVEARVKELMEDEDVTNKKGIYLYILDGDSKHLSIRTFTERDKRTAFEKQNGVCPCCGETFSIEEMEGDHIVPWSKGGRTEFANLQMLCKKCNLKKSNI